MSSVKLCQGSHQKKIRLGLQRLLPKLVAGKCSHLTTTPGQQQKVKVLLPKHAAGKAYTTFEDFADAPP